jgi:hypothetical protein
MTLSGVTSRVVVVFVFVQSFMFSGAMSMRAAFLDSSGGFTLSSTAGGSAIRKVPTQILSNVSSCDVESWTSTVLRLSEAYLMLFHCYQHCCTPSALLYAVVRHDGSLLVVRAASWKPVASTYHHSCSGCS